MGRLDFKKVNIDKLTKYGFIKQNENYIYNIEFDGFNLYIECSLPNNIKTKLTELETGEIYTLHLTNSEGEFVGKIREQYIKILNEIYDKCFDSNIFKTKQANEIIKYIKEKYDNEIEYLWEKFPNNGIARRKDNSKWYLAILTVQKNHFGFNDDEIVEIINLKVDKSKMQETLTNPNIYPAYHMNKKSWISIILDGSVDIKEIYKLIDKSYKLVK